MNAVICSVIFLALVSACAAQSTPILPPKLIRDMNGLAISESAPVGSVVYKLVAEGQYGPFFFEFIEVDTLHIVTPFGNETDVTLTRKLDYELGEKFYTVQIEVTDTIQQTYTAISTIEIIDANDNSPVFGRETYSQTIPEDYTVGTDVISNVVITDVDFVGEYLNVYCDPTWDEDLTADTYKEYVEACSVFAPRKMSTGAREWLGSISLVQPLDYESRNSYQIPIVATDGFNQAFKSFEIVLTDISDSPPVFIDVPGNIRIPENIPLRSNIGNVTAVDGDANVRRPIVYQLIPCNDTDTERKEAMQFFGIHLSEGMIYTQTDIDREDPRFASGLILCVKAREVLNVTSREYGNTPLTTATTTVNIDVVDLNDEGPSFISNEYSTYIYEDILDGTPLDVQLSISDLDEPPMNAYKIQLFNYRYAFDVFPEFGSSLTVAGIRVKNTTEIDYEIGPRKFGLVVHAIENVTATNRRRRTGTAAVTVYVLDLNDNSPIFVRPNYTTTISELDPGIEPIIKDIWATDPDSGSMGTSGIVYSILGSENQRFNIVKAPTGPTADVLVAPCDTPGKAPCIDFEQKRVYHFTVIARDEYGGPRGHQGTAELIVYVRDENDNPPVFRSDSYLGDIREGETNLVNPLRVQADDLDTVGEVRYTLIDSPETPYWQINPTSGLITAREPIFYTYTPGSRGWFSFVVMASDGKNINTATVRINVIDVNNFAPVFLIRDYFVSIPEDTKGNVFIIEVNATDADSDIEKSGKITYSIEYGKEGKFEINPESGVIKTTSSASFDYDVKHEYIMIVVARDGSSTQKSGTATVTVSIVDKNNKLPYFTPLVQFAEITENEENGTFVAVLSAQDPDRDHILRYAFVEPISGINPDGINVSPLTGFGNWFRLEGESGIVRVNDKMNRDTASVITYSIIVTDISDLNNQQTGRRGRLIIRIKEFNDQAPRFLQDVYNLDVEEEQSLGAFVFALLAEDEDDAINRYEIVGGDLSLFAVQPQTGVLTVRNRIDFEAIESTQFTIVAVDTGKPPLTGSAVVNVNIININDNTPKPGKNTYAATIPENSVAGTYITTVTASDDDKGDYGEVRYKMPENVDAFTVDPLTGVMRLGQGVVLDRETNLAISTRVIVEDSPLNLNVSRQASVTVYITLADENDNAPVFIPDSYTKEIIESVQVGAIVLQVYATDADIDDNAAIRFRKIPGSGDPKRLFNITDTTGQIFVARNLRGHIGVHKFNISATDRRGAPDGLVTYAMVTITVIESINSAPVWVIPPYENMTIEVLESQYLGMLVYDAHAVDYNSGVNGIVEYYLQTSVGTVSRTDAFIINRVTGVIRADMVFDRETVDQYTLHLVAMDKGIHRMRTERVMNVVILDVNDNIPEFPHSGGVTLVKEISIWENTTSGAVIGRVTATDRDLEEFSIIYYSIVAGGGNLFTVNEETGEIKLSGSLDRERTATHTFNIQASNYRDRSSVITQSRTIDLSIISVVVTLKDVNDEAPVFVGFNGPDANIKEYYAYISVRAPFDQEIVQLQVLDSDLAGPAGVSFSIIAGNIDNAFSVNRFGLITNTRLLSELENRVYILTVAAFDGIHTTTTTVKIFVAARLNELKLVFGLRLVEVEFLRAQIIRMLHSINLIKYAGIMRITNHIQGQTALSTKSDVFVVAAVAVAGGGYRILTMTELLNILIIHRRTVPVVFENLYIQGIGGGAGVGYLDNWKPVLAVFIIVLLLLLLALLLLLLMCCCCKGWCCYDCCYGLCGCCRSKTSCCYGCYLCCKSCWSTKPRKRSRTVVTAYGAGGEKINPMYDNMTYDSSREGELRVRDYLASEEVYAVVDKSKNTRVVSSVSDVQPFVDEGPIPVIETTVVEGMTEHTRNVEEHHRKRANGVKVERKTNRMNVKDGGPTIIETYVDTDRSDADSVDAMVVGSSQKTSVDAYFFGSHAEVDAEGRSQYPSVHPSLDTLEEHSERSYTGDEAWAVEVVGTSGRSSPVGQPEFKRDHQETHIISRIGPAVDSTGRIIMVDDRGQRYIQGSDVDSRPNSRDVSSLDGSSYQGYVLETSGVDRGPGTSNMIIHTGGQGTRQEEVSFGVISALGPVQEESMTPIKVAVDRRAVEHPGVGQLVMDTDRPMAPIKVEVDRSSIEGPGFNGHSEHIVMERHGTESRIDTRPLVMPYEAAPTMMVPINTRPINPVSVATVPANNQPVVMEKIGTGTVDIGGPSTVHQRGEMHHESWRSQAVHRDRQIPSPSTGSLDSITSDRPYISVEDSKHHDIHPSRGMRPIIGTPSQAVVVKARSHTPPGFGPRSLAPITETSSTELDIPGHTAGDAYGPPGAGSVSRSSKKQASYDESYSSEGPQGMARASRSFKSQQEESFHSESMRERYLDDNYV